MGEDRIAFAEKRNVDVLPPSRQRHSSIISSCSEDTETESTSYTPLPDDEKEEEYEYGPGIVNKLRTKFLSISLKQNRGIHIRRSCSMENLLDQDRPARSNVYIPNRFNSHGKESDDHRNQVWGNLKRAKSMDTLLMDLQPEPPPVHLQSEMNGDTKKEAIIIRRIEGSIHRTGPVICDEELPKPDTVKTYKRMFEPAESRRGSYSRRPPVLRASAKSGTLSVSKTNNVSSSAKINGVVSKSKICAKPPTTPKPEPELVANQPVVNGDISKPLCNGSFVKAVPAKVIEGSLCNGKTVEMEKNVHNLNMNRKDTHTGHMNGGLCNGNSAQKEQSVKKEPDSIVKPIIKELVNQSIKITNGTENVIASMELNINGIKQNINGVKQNINGIKQKPKVPPNRPNFIKNVKSLNKMSEMSNLERKSPTSKLKLNPNVSGRDQESVKPEIKDKIEKIIPKDVKVNGESKPDLKDKEIKLAKVKEEKLVEEHNHKNTIKADPEIFQEVVEVGKPEIAPKKIAEKQIIKQVNAPVQEKENEKLTNDISTTDSTNVKVETKHVKKQQSASSATTSMVFDFRGKDVVPHVAVLPVPFGCKALHPKKRPLLIDGKELPNGNGVLSDDEDEYTMDYSVPPPSGVTFEGENVKIGKGSILSIRNKDLKIKFDDNVNDNTFIYPSETSLLEDSDQSLSPTPPLKEELRTNGQIPPSSSSKLKTNTVIGTSGSGGLATYTPSVLRTMDNFEPSMFRQPPAIPDKEEEKRNCSGEEENTEVREEPQEEQEMLKPADPGIISSWSLSAGTSDLLF